MVIIIKVLLDISTDDSIPVRQKKLDKNERKYTESYKFKLKSLNFQNQNLKYCSQIFVRRRHRQCDPNI